MAALAGLREVEADRVGARVGRLHRAFDVDEARRVERCDRVRARRRGADRERDGVLVHGDRADRRAKRRPLVGLLLERGWRGLLVEEALVDHDVAVDSLHAVCLQLLDERP